MTSILFEDASSSNYAIWRDIVTDKLSTWNVHTRGYHLYYTATSSQHCEFTPSDHQLPFQLPCLIDPVPFRRKYMWKKCSATDSEIVFVLQITERVRNIQYSVINLCQPPQVFVVYNLYMILTWYINCYMNLTCPMSHAWRSGSNKKIN